MTSGHPRRELDSLDSPQDLREALHAARTAQPSPERLLATRAALLERAGGMGGSTGSAAGAGTAGAGAGGLGGAGTAASSSTGASVTGAPATAPALGAGKLLLGALAVAVVSGALVWNARLEPTVPMRSASAGPEAPVRPHEPEVTPATVEEPASPADPARDAERAHEEPGTVEPVEPERAAAAEATAAAPRRIKRGRATRRRPAARPKPTPQVDPGEEVALLSAARDALQDHPAQTLRLTSEHAELFPEGAFVQEREVLAVHALLRRGERERALQRGGRFLARYPRSTHARRVARLLEEASR